MTKPDLNSPSPEIPTETDAARTRPSWVKTIWILTGIIVALVVALASFAYAYSSSNKSDRTAIAVQADCPTWHDISQIPPSATSTTSGLRLYADFRISFYRLNCANYVVNGKRLGPLLPADPRLYPYLPTGDR